MDLQKRSDSLNKAKKQLNDKSCADKIHKEGKSTAYDIMGMLFDDGTFVETNAYVKAYANELGTQNPEEYEGVVCGYGAIDGRLVFAYAQNAARLNGAFSKAAANKISAVYDMALKNGAPVVAIFDSNGAKIEEGVDVLKGEVRILEPAQQSQAGQAGQHQKKPLPPLLLRPADADAPEPVEHDGGQHHADQLRLAPGVEKQGKYQKYSSAPGAVFTYIV